MATLYQLVHLLYSVEPLRNTLRFLYRIGQSAF